MIGQPVRRTEDPTLLRGEGRYTDDLNEPGQAYAYIVRSPYAHARILSIDAREAEALPGVIAVITSKDFTDISPYMGRGKNKDHPIIAVDRVIFAGQPVAAVTWIAHPTNTNHQPASPVAHAGTHPAAAANVIARHMEIMRVV